MRISFLLLLLSIAAPAHAISNSQALADADAYIQEHRRGPAHVRIVGLAPGTPAEIRQTRSAFHFGAAVHEGYQLDSSAYATRFAQNFNTVVAGGPGYWSQTDGANKMAEVHKLAEWAADRGMHTRLHNLIYENDQPSWVKQLGNTAMRNAISDRIDYYFDTPSGVPQYHEIDVYNESWNKGEKGGSGTYWNRLGVSGIASIYNESAAATAGRVFVNDYGALQGGHEGFADHIEKLIGAGGTVEGVGVEYYSDSGSSNIPSDFREAFDRLDDFGQPIVVTEWGLFESANPTALKNSLRMAYGHPAVTGFHLWDWTDLDPWSFAEAGALYRVSGNTYTLTDMGRAWQELVLGEWRTNLDVQAGAGGVFDFTGHFGEYEITAGGETYHLTLSAGQGEYLIGADPGDFNGDGAVDAADYTIWRDTGGSTAEYLSWKESYGAAPLGSAVPEGNTLPLLLTVAYLRRRQL